MSGMRCGWAGLGLAWVVLAAPVAPAVEEPRQHQVPELKVERYALPNGLTVLLHEDHKTPVVAVQVYYKAGSKDEQPGRTGFAHLFEHMMFLGSQHHDEDFSRPLERLGAEHNATTDEDRTEYYETVPSNALERTLWLEADRMGFLLPAMTARKLDTERDVVKNERRETVENAPYGQADETIREALYPEGHPYRHSVIGSMADLSAAGPGDIAAFFRKYYAPDNAILCVAGDFVPEQARQWIARYFGRLPRGPEVARPRAGVPKVPVATRIQLTDDVSLPRAQLIWPTVPAGHPDEPALDVLAAILGGLAKESRLFRALMYDRQLAASVTAEHPTHLLAGTFEVELYAHPDRKLHELVKLADAELERLKRDGPTALEVRKAQNERESGLILGLQSVTRKAAVFTEYLAMLGDPLAYRTELTKVFAVTPADVQRVARQYLGANRIELDIFPGDPAARLPEAGQDRAKPAPTAAPEAVPPPAAVQDDFNRSAMPPLGPTPHYQPPRFQRRRLSNGLELRIVERHELPIVTVDLVVKAGETSTPKGKEGLASLAASLLDEGTKSRSALQLAGELAEIGASLQAGGDLESSTVNLTTLTRHLDHALDLFADVLTNPSFPAQELDRLKLQRLAQLKARTDDPEETAAAVFPRLIYGPDHPYGRPDLGTAESVRSITRDDVLAFHRRILVPGLAVLVVVGDVRPDAITAALESRLAAWAAGPVPPAPSLEPLPAPPQGRPVSLIDKPAAAQSVLTVGRIGAARKSPDFSALTVLNAILGGQFASRINRNLREEKGYSYGADSSFSFDRGPGPFEARATVETSVTKESLVELFKELTDIAGSRPVTDAELAFAKERLILGFPSRFETTFGVAGHVANLVAYDLPDDELDRYQARIEALTRADIDRVAKQYITPESMTILIVGDRAQVEGPLKSLPWIKAIRRLDAEGNPLPRPIASEP
ncbi:MAG TPA: pitrilysin family protein [Isosphaeraceae bacterium]|nr:pitrilysin family protein [Isosphaeraceae bacterium]